MSGQQHESNAQQRGKTAEPSDLPPDLQQANVSNAKKVEEDVVEPIQQYREGRRRRKTSPNRTK
jgi:hypothetical protein